jgi:hypothetical protein
MLGSAGIDALLGNQILGSVIEDYEPESGRETVGQQFDDRPAKDTRGDNRYDFDGGLGLIV